MVFFNEKKFACQTCIKGHRSSGCKHTDRPLFEIKKKGRPVTQCDHCRELRKTKQVHVRCQCGAKEDPASPVASNNRISGLSIPSFPNGIAPETLSSLNQSRHLDSAVPNPCLCEIGGECHCCTPRSSYKSKSKRSPTNSSDPNIPRSNGVVSPTLGDPSRSVHHQLGTAQTLGLQPSYSPSGPEGMGSSYPPFDSSGSNHRAAAEVWNDNQISGGAYPGPSQLQRDLGQYDGTNVNNYSEHTSLQTPAPPTSPVSSNPICNCGTVCQCPGCSEHLAPDGFPSAAPMCTVGCSTGLGCLNDPHVHPPSHFSSSVNTYQSSTPSHLYHPDQVGHHADNGSTSSVPLSLSISSARFPSTTSFHTLSSATSYATTTASHLDGSIGYSHAPTWSSGTTTPAVSEPSRRTSFAISGERDACSSSSSLPPQQGFSVPQSRNREQPPTASSPVYPPSHSQAFPSDNQPHSPQSYLPFRNQRRNPTSASNGPGLETASGSTSKPSVVRRGFQRLLPRNPPEQAPNPGGEAAFIHPVQHLPPTGQLSLPSSHSKALRGETAAAFNRSTMMPYNRLM